MFSSDPESYQLQKAEVYLVFTARQSVDLQSAITRVKTWSTELQSCHRREKYNVYFCTLTFSAIKVLGTC